MGWFQNLTNKTAEVVKNRQNQVTIRRENRWNAVNTIGTNAAGTLQAAYNNGMDPFAFIPQTTGGIGNSLAGFPNAIAPGSAQGDGNSMVLVIGAVVVIGVIVLVFAMKK